MKIEKENPNRKGAESRLEIELDLKQSVAFEKVLKRGIYKELYDKKMLTEQELNIVLSRLS